MMTLLVNSEMKAATLWLLIAGVRHRKVLRRVIGRTEDGGPRGDDAGKKINGRKRHAFVDTDGRGLVLEPHPGSIRDREGGGALLRISRRIAPFVLRLFADSGYAG